MERGDFDSVCKYFFNYIRQVAAAFRVDPQSRTGLIFLSTIFDKSATIRQVDRMVHDQRLTILDPNPLKPKSNHTTIELNQISIADGQIESSILISIIKSQTCDNRDLN